MAEPEPSTDREGEGVRYIRLEERAALRALLRPSDRLACLLCGGLPAGEASGSGDVCLHEPPTSVERVLRHMDGADRQVSDLLSRLAEVERERDMWEHRVRQWEGWQENLNAPETVLTEQARDDERTLADELAEALELIRGELRVGPYGAARVQLDKSQVDHIVGALARYHQAREGGEDG